MSLWRQITRGLRALTHRAEAEQDLSDEVQHYLEQAAEKRIQQGLSRREAYREARLEIGNETVVREQVRESGWEHIVRTVLADVRYGFRGLRNRPGFTAITILTLALGIGATTAIFSAVNPILLEALPYPHSSRLMMLWEKRADGGQMPPSFGTYHGLAERTRSIDKLAAMKPWQATVTGSTEPERLEGQRVSASYFQVLGVSPAIGRDLQESDDQYHGPDVVILSDRLWRRRFGGDTNIIGRPVTIDDRSFTVVGVMPPSFENVLSPAAEIWAPLQYDRSLPPDGREWGHHLRMVGRLRSGVANGEANREVDVILAILAKAYAKGYASSGGPAKGMVVTPLQEDLTRGVRPALLAIIGAVLLVLVIACVNVTNLLLARGVQRRSEFALRAALGAGRSRMLRQLLTESLLLATMGGAVGMAVAMLGVRALVALSPAGLPRAGAIRVDSMVFLFGVGITTLVGLAFGLVPALQAARSAPQQEIRQGVRTSRHRRIRNALVVAEVALALVLLVSAGLLLRSLQKSFAVDPGFDSSHLLTMQVQMSGHRYKEDSAKLLYFDQVLEAVRHVPGVSSAGFTGQLPLSGDFEVYGTRFNRDASDRGEALLRYSVTLGYLETMRIPLRRGRLFNEQDTTSSPKVVLINESLSRRRFQGQDPIGQRVCIRCDVGDEQQWATIIGEVGNVRQVSLELANEDAVYMPNSQWYWAESVMSLVVRVQGDAGALAPAVRQAIWSVDKDQPVARVATMEGLLAASSSERRFALLLFEAFAIAALVLAAAGIYSVLSGSVAERTQEIGVRVALGATRGNILTLIFQQAMGLATLGVLTGLAGAVATSQAIAAMLFGVSRLDPGTYLSVIALLLGVSGVACWVPAWRAARVDPAMTLRAQ